MIRVVMNSIQGDFQLKKKKEREGNVATNIKLKKELPSGKVRAEFLKEIREKFHVVLSIWKI